MNEYNKTVWTIRLLILFLVAWVIYWSAAPAAGAVSTEQYQETVLPAVERQFLTTIPLDCQIRDETPESFVLRCRINIGIKEKWIKGPTPVVKLPAKKPIKKRKKNASR